MCDHEGSNGEYLWLSGGSVRLSLPGNAMKCVNMREAMVGICGYREEVLGCHCQAMQ